MEVFLTQSGVFCFLVICYLAKNKVSFCPQFLTRTLVFRSYKYKHVSSAGVWTAQQLPNVPKKSLIFNFFFFFKWSAFLSKIMTVWTEVWFSITAVRTGTCPCSVCGRPWLVCCGWPRDSCWSPSCDGPHLSPGSVLFLWAHRQRCCCVPVWNWDREGKKGKLVYFQSNSLWYFMSYINCLLILRLKELLDKMSRL